MIGVIADDLTGAAEIAAIGWRFGLRSEVSLALDPTSTADLIVIDADSRSRPPAEAANRIASAAAHLKAQSPEWIFKKIDSVLRGHVVTEIHAMLEALQLQHALLIPGNVSRKRVVKNGQLLIEDQPLHKTEFQFDPDFPAKTSDVLQLLGSSPQLPTFILRPGEQLAARGLFIGEAPTPEHLAQWSQQISAGTLPVGSADFFTALLKTQGFTDQKQSPPPLPADKTLFVCGSASPSTKQFLARCRSAGVPVFSFVPEDMASQLPSSRSVQHCRKEALAALQCHQQMVVAIDLPPLKAPQASTILLAHLTEVATALLSSGLVRHVCIEGGATAASIARQLGWSRLPVAAEFAPGIASMELPPLLITIKPGSYKWPESFWLQEKN